MKRMIAIILAAAMLFSLSACVSSSDEEGNVRIYYISTDGSGRKTLEYEKCSIEGNTFEEKLNNVLEALKNPTAHGAEPVIPKGIAVESVKERGSTVQINYNDMYYYLGASEKLMAATAVCMAIFTMGNIQYIKITAGGRSVAPLYDEYYFKGKFVLDENAYLE